jgi:hypothetical protein
MLKRIVRRRKGLVIIHKSDGFARMAVQEGLSRLFVYEIQKQKARFFRLPASVYRE